MVGFHLGSQGPYSNYVDKILEIFDPPSSSIAMHRQVYYISLCSSIDIWQTPPLPPRLSTQFVYGPLCIIFNLFSETFYRYFLIFPDHLLNKCNFTEKKFQKIHVADYGYWIYVMTISVIGLCSRLQILDLCYDNICNLLHKPIADIVIT